MTQENNYHITSENALSTAINAMAGLPLDGRYQVTIKKTSKQRSGKQNNSQHLYLRMMAQAFNDAGLDQRMVINKFSDGFSIPVTMEFLKEVFQQVASGMFDKKSTAELTTVQIQDVYEAFIAGMGQKYGISRPWPHVEEK